jgi:hypothetical protein
MNPLFLIPFAFACFALSPVVQGQQHFPTPILRGGPTNTNPNPDTVPGDTVPYGTGR